jgi:hypothetical protein
MKGRVAAVRFLLTVRDGRTGIRASPRSLSQPSRSPVRFLGDFKSQESTALPLRINCLQDCCRASQQKA